MALGSAAAAVVVFGLGIAPSAAQDKFPSETIEVVTHAGAGGGTDITTRMMMLRGRREFGVDMAVVNKRGGGGATAMNYINGRPRDGHAIMTITPTHLATIARGKSPLKIDDLVGIARATDDPQILMVNKDSPYTSAEQFVDAQKAEALKYGTTQVGGIDHITAFMFARRAGIKEPTIVPFKGGGDLVTNLVGGNIDVGVLNLSEAESQIAAGEVRPLIVLAKKRMAPLPDVPTAPELGIDAVFSTLRGFVTLKGPAEDRLQVLENGLLKAMKHKVYQSYLTSVGLTGDSVQGAAAWNEQIDQLYSDTQEALKALGML
jgi:tripartite-type tricarboxylate transporter receptor subunit TctC